MMNNGMFTNFTNLNTSYSPNPFQPTYPQQTFQNIAAPAHPNKPYEILSPDKRTVLGYFWYYGNSVDLIFDFSDSEYGMTTENGYVFGSNGQIEGPKPIAILVEELLPTLKFEATFYNFRHEPIVKFSNDPLISKNEIKINGTDLIMSVTHEISSQLIKGKYCLEMIALHPGGYHETIFSSEMNNGLYFEVK